MGFARRANFWDFQGRDNRSFCRLECESVGLTPGPDMQNELLEKKRSLAARIAFPAYMLVAIPYLVWRAWTVYFWGQWYFWPLLASELLSVALTLLYLGTARKISIPIFKTASTDRTVDIFIPTYNEPEDVVKMTVIGALHVRGVRDVYLLDDGCRLAMRAMADSLGAKYLSRQDNTHAKAGNMNAGILHSDAELMLFLDCDHVPQPEIIERTIGYFDDPELAFVQTPQLFYNTSSVQFRRTGNRPLWNEQSMFYEAIQPSKNCFNAAFFCGSGALVRRAAIDSIGGFATGTATEDIHTSLRLHAHGWRSLFVNEQLAHGIAPVDMAEYHKQRTRWGAGSLGLLFRSPDSPLRAKGLSLAQRVCYFNSTFSFTFGLQRIFYMLFPALLLLALPLTIDDRHVDVLFYVSIMLAFVSFSYICTWVISDGTYHPIYTEQYNLANMFSHAEALRGIIRVSAKFAVSAKTKSLEQRSRAENGLLMLCVFLGVMSLYGLAFWAASGRPLSAILTNMAGLAFFWNTLNFLLIVPFLLFLRRHDAAGEPACVLAVPDVPAMLAGGEARREAIVTRLDLTGATITVPGGGVTPGEHHLTLDTPRGPIQVHGDVTGITPRYDNACEVQLSFGKLSPQLAVALTTYLFHEVVPQTLRYGRQAAAPAPLPAAPALSDFREAALPA